MFVELTLAFHATIFPLDQAPSEPDANLALVAVAVMLGHAEGQPMNASQLAAYVQMPRTSVMRRLDALLAHGLIRRIQGKYYLEPARAKGVPHRETFDLILSKGFAVLGPYLSKMDT
jgi:DNA-binding transcriptional ArsR family regulator